MIASPVITQPRRTGRGVGLPGTGAGSYPAALGGHAAYPCCWSVGPQVMPEG